MAWQLKLTNQDLFVKLCCIWIFKRKVSYQHSIQGNTTAPNVDVNAVIPFTSDHLRCRIAGTSTGSLKCLAWSVTVAESKINDLNVVLSI